MERDYYTTEEAAEQLGVTVGRVRQMIVDGLLQTQRFGRAHMISRDALKAAEARRTKPGPAPKAGQSSGASRAKTNGAAKPGTIAPQTRTTRRLDRTVKRDADDRMAGGKKGGRK